MRKRICKKAASLALALAMAVSVCTTALADGDTEQTTTETTSISEQTKGNGGEDGPSTKAVENGATLTLDEFNALTEIPADVTELTVDIGEQTIAKSGNKLVIGSRPTDSNKDAIADYYYHRNVDNLTEEDKTHLVGYQGTSTTDAILTTDKAGITLHVKGTINADTVDNPDKLGNDVVQFYLPDKSTVILDGMTINGTVDFTAFWQQIASEGYNPESTEPHCIDTMEFKSCVINGAIYKNGGNARNLIIDGCTFNRFVNPEYASNTNPIWYKNAGSQDMGWVKTKASNITIQNCHFYAERPVKVHEQSVEGMTLKVVNNVFEMFTSNSADVEGEPKYDALMFSNVKGKSGSVEITGNTVTNANALLTFYKPTNMVMADDATFVVKNNELNNTKIGAVWKSAEEYVPDFVTVIKPATVVISTAAPSVRADDVTDETLIQAAKTVGIFGESVDAVENSDAVAAVKADAEKTYKNGDNTWNESKLKEALEGSALANTDVNKITLVVVPYLAITPKQTDAKDQLTFAIELLCDLRATTDPDNMTPANTCTISTTNISANAPTVTIQLSVGSAFTVDQLTGLYVKHDSTKGVRYYDTTVVNVDSKTIAFENPDGYSDFTVMYSADEAVVDFEGTSKTLNLTSLNDKTLPAPAKTENFLGWQFAGVDGTYTELDEALLAKLAAAYKAAGKTLTATAQYKTVEQPTPAPTEAPKPTAAPTAAPTAVPAVTAAPAPTAAPAANNKYYTCTACGHHNWTATGEGYKCDTCGHLESAKQLSGYANVKGVYTPQTTGAAQAAKASTIPQTSDDMPIVPIVVISIAALLGLGVTAYLKKKQN